MFKPTAALGCLFFLLLAGPAQALSVQHFSPQGEVAQISQVVARFDGAAVRLGDGRAGAPFHIRCDDAQASAGQGRWNNEREWVFQFAADLPPGVRCTAQPVSGFKSASGAQWESASSYQFNSGGPFVKSIRPSGYERIDEGQYFVLQLSGAATAASVQQHMACQVEGLGERVPVRLIEGAERSSVLQALGLAERAAKAPLQYPIVACQRRLSAGSRMALVFGQGVATPSGVLNRVTKKFDYQVRAPFSADFSCERENAQAACLPIRPLRLTLSAPVARKLALAVRLKSAQETLAPRVGDADADADSQALVSSIEFAAPLAAQTRFELQLPPDFKDASGRSLQNAASFPLSVTTGALPPLAKFAAAPFGIVERFAEGAPSDQPPALLPVTLRKVEAALPVQSLALQTLQPQSDADIIAWQRKLSRYHEGQVRRQRARQDVLGALPPVLAPIAGEDGADSRDWVQARMVSLLAGRGGVQRLELARPKADDPRPFEVVGIPLPVGFSVVEIASPLLGQSLLDARYGSARTMYVRSSALVTNLGVHFKLGRENASAWVTTLDKGRPVAGAQVQVSDCSGKLLAKAVTDAQGLAQFSGLSPEAPSCSGSGEGEDDADGWRSAYFVSARAENEGAQDMAFTWSDWQRGIEPWRFNVPTSTSVQPDEIAHTIFDRTLLRAGETVSMKHLLRTQTQAGFGLPAQLPAQLVITHVGSGQQFTQALAWRSTATGGRSAQSSWQIPPAAKLGLYQVLLQQGERSWESGSFRVEEFRLPVLQGSVAPAQPGALVCPRSLELAVQLNYVGGGGAAQLPVRVSALLRPKLLQFADYDAFSFAPPRVVGSSGARSDDEEEGASQDSRVVADKLALTLDKNGAGQVTLNALPPVERARELLLEASYADPNGELQTLRSTQVLWPAAVVAGIKAEGWAASGSRVRFQALALGLDGKPRAGVPLAVQAIAHSTTSSRKRMVGGFYSYDNQRQRKDLGTVCSGQSDARGLLLCEASIEQSGEVELIASARDAQGQQAQAATSVWITRRGELWFGGEDHDRMDLLPEKKSYAPGETARFQVRMPFRYATALVSVEREGIIEQRVLQLNGQDPTVELQVQPDWGPNVYVSVLALRGRLREVPWYSFFTWGYKAPREWWTAFWFEGKEYVAPTALVDLAKPAYRLGLAEIRVGSQAHQLQVQVQADKDSYSVRGKAQVTITARLPSGAPAAHAEVALAAVDQALLELMPNHSWQLLDAMLARRSWGVSTATAQMEIIGRRHYGKKAVPAGGGGGHSATRELLDTLLLWQPAIRLDAQGQAKVSVPLNDALTSFRIVAVADSGLGLFGTGQTTIRSTQDLQIISGLPPLVRSGDQFRAQLTLRNTTAAAMQVQLTARASLLELAPQQVELAPGQAREVGWDVTAPPTLADTRAQALLWEISARDSASGARDALKVSQRLVPAVPLSVQQASLVQLDGPLQLPVAAPAGALPGRGGLQLALQPRLSEGLPGVRDWWLQYPFACLEQKTSKAIGLRDAALWQQVAAQLPAYLDEDGLASYFPPRAGEASRGSDTLSAYLLAATHEAAALNPAFALPDAVRAALERGLIAFVEGRIERKFWSPRADLPLRKLAALEALSRTGQAQARMLEGITIAPQQWPTHAVIDWYLLLQRMKDIPQRAQRLQEATQLLQSRLQWQGTRLGFSTEQDDQWWWLMQGGDVNSARLLLAALDNPAWHDELARLANGFIARQQGGAWQTTTANFWGALALEKFSARFESAPVSGSTRAQLGAQSARVDWAQVTRAGSSASSVGAAPAAGMYQNNRMFLSWPTPPQPQQMLQVQHEGTGRPWLTLQSLAAVPLKAPTDAGYSVRKTITPIEQGDKSLPAGSYRRGELLRVTLQVTAHSDMTWVAITDPIPAGSTILGSGLGRDSEIATEGEKSTGSGWPAFEERSFEAYRSYYEYLPKGQVTLQYTLRLNNAGDFALPPSRVEALYAPEMFGELPNARVRVLAQPQP